MLTCSSSRHASLAHVGGVLNDAQWRMCNSRSRCSIGNVRCSCAMDCEPWNHVTLSYTLEHYRDKPNATSNGVTVRSTCWHTVWPYYVLYDIAGRPDRASWSGWWSADKQPFESFMRCRRDDLDDRVYVHAALGDIDSGSCWLMNGIRCRKIISPCCCAVVYYRPHDRWDAITSVVVYWHLVRTLTLITRSSRLFLENSLKSYLSPSTLSVILIPFLLLF